MIDVRTGTSGFGERSGGPPAEYFTRFDIVELAQALRRPPRLDEARRLRDEAPADFVFTLRTECDDFRDRPDLRRGWKGVIELARTLHAPLVVFRTPPSFRPDERRLAELTHFFQWAHRDRLRLGWEPRGGHWAPEQVRHLCRELSLTHVTDPFHQPCQRPRPPYFRLAGITGHQHRFTDAQLDELLEMCGETAANPDPPESAAWCIFGNASAAADAERFKHRIGSRR